MKPALAFTILVSLAPGAAVQPASAQSFGIKGGVNFSTIVATPPEELGDTYRSRVGGLGGAFLAFRDASSMSFEVDGQFAMRRFTFGPDIAYAITYIEAPVVARYSFFKRPTMNVRALAGGVTGFRLTASESVGGDSSSVKDAYKPVDFAIVVGAQAEWNNRWQIEVRYQFGLTEVFEVTVGALETRQRGLQILVGYRLR